jgi:peptidoglycan/LPS O-acetylase OafA/YrhL
VKYRSDIDGLRAIAVLSVVLYHIGFASIPGGYLGVDVFFVISGYLICGMIEADIRQHRFSIAYFYQRRVLRIFPALFFMLFCTAAFALIFFLPVELKNFSASLLSVLASVSNMYFGQTAGYFDAGAETKPLLHTWSLGVEEQFYVFAPLLIVLIHRVFPRYLKIAFLVAGVLSLLLQIAVYIRNPVFAFYWMPCRAWELATGAILSIRAVPLPQGKRQKVVIGGAGFVLMILALCFGGTDFPLPLAAFAASLGAACIIASSEGEMSPVGKLLSVRPLVFVGLISYSLYLWHWPMIVFQRTDFFILENGMLAVWTMKIVLLLLSFLAGWLSWKYIETPFRSATKTASRRLVFGGAAVVIAVMGLLSGGAMALQGLPGRFDARTVRIESYLAYDESASFRTGRCFIDTNRQKFDAAYCLHLDSARPNYLLIGDSHAAHLWAGLSKAFPAVNVMQATASICRPVIAAHGLFDNGFCPRMRTLIFDQFLPHNKVDKVLLSASWKREDMPALIATVAALRARHIDVVVLGPIVEYGQALPRLIADEIRYHRPGLAYSLRDPAVPVLDRQMDEAVRLAGGTYISTYSTICTKSVCTEFAPSDIPLQFDTGHLTGAGSLLVARAMAAGRLLN